MSGVIWKSWKPEAVRARVVEELAANGEIVGKFVETEARRRLLAIGEPEWGKGYRKMLADYYLTSLVERKAKEVTIWVGMRTGPKGQQHGLWIELGTATIPRQGNRPGRPGHPAHPYLRPAVFDNGREIVQLLEGR